jgi:predicted dehydrogenase
MHIKRISEEEGAPLIFIGFQLSFSKAVQELKRDIMSGLFGKPLVMKTITHYGRGEVYFSRNSWAGKKYLDDGRLCLDSPMHNAVAHHLNNMLFLLGDSPGRAAYPATVQAELYRANPSHTNYDTFAMRVKTQSNAEILFYSSHSLGNSKNIGPFSVYRFEKATVFHENAERHDAFYVAFDDGSSKNYDALLETEHIEKMYHCANAINGGEKPWSTVEAAIPQVVCTLGASLSHPVALFPQSLVTIHGEHDPASASWASGPLPKVEGLEDLLMSCYDKLKLPSEMENPPEWADSGRIVTLEEIMSLASDETGGKF